MATNAIIKGESYSVAFMLKDNGEPITPETVQGVRIALGNQIATYPDGNLTFSNEDNTWRFPMSQKNTLSIQGKVMDYQAQVKIGTEIFSCKMQKITMDETMFRKEWV